MESNSLIHEAGITTSQNRVSIPFCSISFELEWNLSPDLLVQRVTEILIKAQNTIRRAFRSYYLKKLMKSDILLVDIWLEGDYPETDIFVIGDFYCKPWTKFIKMRYSISHGWYVTQVLMKFNAQFKFYSNGRYFWSEAYDTILNEDGISNNRLKIASKEFLSRSTVTKKLEKMNSSADCGFSIKRKLTWDYQEKSETKFENNSYSPSKFTYPLDDVFTFLNNLSSLTLSKRSSLKIKKPHPLSAAYSTKKPRNNFLSVKWVPQSWDVRKKLTLRKNSSYKNKKRRSLETDCLEFNSIILENPNDSEEELAASEKKLMKIANTSAQSNTVKNGIERNYSHVVSPSSEFSDLILR